MVENEEGFLRESRRDWEKLGGGGEQWEGWERWEQWEGWERWEQWERWEGWGASRTGRVWNSPRLTYSAIADNPEGGLAGKWRLRMGGLRIKNNFY